MKEGIIYEKIKNIDWFHSLKKLGEGFLAVCVISLIIYFCIWIANNFREIATYIFIIITVIFFSYILGEAIDASN
jgi:multisubunit Na+/H+ antiporter MnhG subunit